ncbi:hypothetical protein Sjap_025774 [Stephania japonica]|uniref:Aminotransferase class I/classII large domain-containing protein n=1 Tax=Stephania japonica TaxID=461633 RepID=A0AAP0HEH3_9MAGN
MEINDQDNPKWRLRATQQTPTKSIREVLTLLVNSRDAADQRPFIQLGHGDPSAFPSFRTARINEDAIVDAVKSGSFNSYAPALGLLPTRRAIAEYLSADLPYRLSSDDILVTTGGRQAIRVVLSALAGFSTANVLFPKPGYPFYEVTAKYVNLEFRHFNLLPERGWEVDIDSLESLADENTVAMVIINPGNPCGNVYSYQHLNQIAETAKKLGIFVISDEAYGHLAFGSKPFVPMGVFGAIVPVFTLGTLSKRWTVPGWRLGWVATSDPSGALKETKVVDCLIDRLDFFSNPTTFVQGAVPKILENAKGEFFNNYVNLLSQCADTCCNKVQEIECINCPSKPEGSMFVMVKLDVWDLDDIRDDMEFCMKLAKEEAVIVLPGTALGLKGWLRITFAIEPSLLEEGLAKLKAFCKRHTKQK